ncbi:MAG TPA: tripartite tricarboxylate transporter substrate binding protein, partial [Burkholderiales bacterium]|nr:tripartite tricarboxylate transporter substrate binding protein [Burkholderiales bacterium]
GLPADITASLSTALAGALSDPAIISWAKKTGTELLPRTPEQAAKIVSEQADFYDAWKKIIDAT